MDAQSASNQTISATREYDAFGSVASSTGPFTGKFVYGGGFGYQEDDGGLKLLGHRYYDPVCGRFITRDPAGNKSGPNLFTYCYNRPTKFVDADGRLEFLPSNPEPLLEGGWSQDPQHGGEERVPGAKGRYFPPGGGRGTGSGALEFDPAKAGQPGERASDHWHEDDSKDKKLKPHLKPGEPAPERFRNPLPRLPSDEDPNLDPSREGHMKPFEPREPSTWETLTFPLLPGLNGAGRGAVKILSRFRWRLPERLPRLMPVPSY